MPPCTPSRSNQKWPQRACRRPAHWPRRIAIPLVPNPVLFMVIGSCRNACSCHELRVQGCHELPVRGRLPVLRLRAQNITHLTSKHLSSFSEVHPAWPPAGGHACAQSAASSPNLLAGRARGLLLVACTRPYIRVRAIGRRVAPPSSRFLTSFPTSRRSFVPPRSPRRRTW